MPLTEAALSTLAILVLAVGLLVSGRLRADLVALLVVVGLGATGVLTPQEVFSGFSSSAVIAIAAVFVLAEGIQRTGGSDRVGAWLVSRAGHAESRLVAVIMTSGALLSLFMNNIAAASVLLPAVSGVSKRTGVSPSRLFLPLAYATLLGGMATLFTTTNILVSGLLRDAGFRPFSVVEFLPVGLPVSVFGIAFMVLAGRRALPSHSDAERYGRGVMNESLASLYGLGSRLFRVRIPSGSYLDGQSLGESRLRERYNVDVVAIERFGQSTPAPTPDTDLRAGDLVTLQGDMARLRTLDTAPYFEYLPVGDADEELASDDVVVAEAVLSPRSGLIGHSLRDVDFREVYGFSALAIWRSGTPISSDVAVTPLNFGDALLLQGPHRRLGALRTDPDLILMDEAGLSQGPRRPAKLPLAAAILAGAILVAGLGWLPTAETMLAAALLMILSRCLTPDEAYGAIEGRAVILVAGMLPLGLALSKSGVAAATAGGLVAAVGPLGWQALIASLFAVSVLVTQLTGGPVAATIMAPIAIQAGRQFSADPRILALAVAVATSIAFVSPVGHPVNVLVMGPGGYRVSDYLRVGLPLAILCSLVALVVLRWLYLPPV